MFLSHKLNQGGGKGVLAGESHPQFKRSFSAAQKTSRGIHERNLHVCFVWSSPLSLTYLAVGPV